MNHMNRRRMQANAPRSVAVTTIDVAVNRDDDDGLRWATPGRPAGGWPGWTDRKELAELILSSMVGVDGFGPVACGRAAMRELRRERFTKLQALCLVPLLVSDYGLDLATAKECMERAYARMQGLDDLRLEVLCADLRATETAVMLAMIDLCAEIGEPGQIVTASHRLIAEIARVDRKTVAKTLIGLRERGWLALIGSGRGGGSRWSLPAASHQGQSARHRTACVTLDMLDVDYQEEAEIKVEDRTFYGDIVVEQDGTQTLVEIDGRFVHQGDEQRKSATKERLKLLQKAIDRAITIDEDDDLVARLFETFGKQDDDLEELRKRVSQTSDNGPEDRSLEHVTFLPPSLRGSSHLCAGPDLMRLPEHDSFEHGCLRSARPTLELVMYVGPLKCADLGVIDGPDPGRTKYRRRRRHVARLIEAGLIELDDGHYVADLDDLVSKLDRLAEIKGKTGRGTARRDRHQSDRLARDAA